MALCSPWALRHRPPALLHRLLVLPAVFSHVRARQLLKEFAPGYARREDLLGNLFQFFLAIFCSRHRHDSPVLNLQLSASFHFCIALRLEFHCHLGVVPDLKLCNLRMSEKMDFGRAPPRDERSTLSIAIEVDEVGMVSNH